MDMLFTISFDAIAFSGIACLALREAMIFALPDRIAGPGGSFIDTGR